jgi:hypothetical protein
VSGLGHPPINDITTDLENPPAFPPASAVPDYAGRDMSYPPEFVSVVRDHYPDLRPIDVSDPPSAAFAKASAAAEIDIRSKSRDGRGDLGANAIRIRAFADALR